MQRLVEIFFERVNGKPYTLFHERMFRQDWQEGRVPSYVLDTICAVSVRWVLLVIFNIPVLTLKQICIRP